MNHHLLLFGFFLLNLMRRRNAFLSSECKVPYGGGAGEWNEGLAFKDKRFRETDIMPGTGDTIRYAKAESLFA
jgi:hypothetical protein